MVLVRNTMLLPGGDPVPMRVTAKARIQLMNGGFAVTGAPEEAEIIGQFYAPVDSQGHWEIDLIPNELIDPDGTIYRVEETAGRVTATHHFVVPRFVDVLSSSRTSNVVTAVLETVDHGIRVGDSVTVDLADNTYDGTFTVTEVTADTIKWSQVAANDPAGGTGIVNKTIWDLYDLVSEAPFVLNPAPLNMSAPVSLAEVEQLIARSPAGFVRSMDPKTPLTAFIANSTTEASALNAVFQMPRVIHEAVFKMTAHGIARCTAGGPVNLTMRLKNLTDGTVLATAVLSIINDADGNRPWFFEVDGEGTVVLADSVASVGRFSHGPGSGGAGIVSTQVQSLIGFGTDPQNWDLTGQFSVANAGITATIYGAKVFYALPGVNP